MFELNVKLKFKNLRELEIFKEVIKCGTLCYFLHYGDLCDLCWDGKQPWDNQFKQLIN